MNRRIRLQCCRPSISAMEFASQSSGHLPIASFHALKYFVAKFVRIRKLPAGANSHDFSQHTSDRTVAIVRINVIFRVGDPCSPFLQADLHATWNKIVLSKPGDDMFSARLRWAAADSLDLGGSGGNSSFSSRVQTASVSVCEFSRDVVQGSAGRAEWAIFDRRL